MDNDDIQAWQGNLGHNVPESPTSPSPFVFQEEIRAGKQAIIKAEIVLVDGSCLIIREYIGSKYGIEKLSYAYQYQDSEGNLIFRYDNAAHKPNLEKPEHRHSPEGIDIVHPPDMAKLVDEVIGYL